MTAFHGSRFLRDKFRELGISAPRIHFVLGSALASAFEEIEVERSGFRRVGELFFSEIPGLQGATAPGHSGIFKYLRHEHSGQGITFQVGRLHGYEGLTARQVAQPVMVSRLAGARQFILTNAAGSLDPSFEVGSVMVLRDHVNLTGQNPLVGPNLTDEKGCALGPRFPDMSQVYGVPLSKALSTSMKDCGLKVNEGTYLGLLGPSFETPAEIALFSKWGLHAVGMSTVWEAIALQHSGAEIAGLSLISNQGCGLGGRIPLSHDEILVQSQRSAQKIIQGLFTLAESECSHP